MLCFSLVSERRERPGWDLKSGLFFSNSVCVGVGGGDGRGGRGEACRWSGEVAFAARLGGSDVSRCVAISEPVARHRGAVTSPRSHEDKLPTPGTATITV